MGDLPVCQYVVTIPKMLRLCFKYDRKPLGLLSQSFYASVKEFFQDAAGDRRAVPGMIASLQTYGDEPTRFHSHLHCLTTDGLVSPEGSFVPVACPDPLCLMQLFRHKLVKALLAREKITPRMVEIMQNWVYPGFSVFQGERIDPDDHEARRRLAGHMVHPPIALGRLPYRSEAGQVICYGRQRGRGGDVNTSPARIFPALDFLAALCTHLPDRAQQLVRYYGAIANARRVCAGAPASSSASQEGAHEMPQHNSDSSEEFARERRRSWARLIKRVYEADPLVCPRCFGPLKIISLISDVPAIEKILRHLKLWNRPEHPRPPPAAQWVHYDEKIVDRDEAGQGPDATG